MTESDNKSKSTTTTAIQTKSPYSIYDGRVKYNFLFRCAII
jgi:hypothetical protein